MKMLRLFLVAIGVFTLLGSVSPLTGAQGTSANAKLCQKGGWEQLQGSGGERFANQGECVAYGARGGTLSTIPVLNPVISAAVQGVFPLGVESMLVRVSGSNFPAATEIDLQWVLTGGSSSQDTVTGFDVVMTDAAGNLREYALNQAQIPPEYTPIPCDDLGNPTGITIKSVNVATGQALATTSATLTCVP